jgi:hypothetical protein
MVEAHALPFFDLNRETTNCQYKNQFNVVGYDTCRCASWIAKAGAFQTARARTLSQVMQWEFTRDLLKRNWFDESNSEANGGTGTDIEVESDEWEEELMELYSASGMQDRASETSRRSRAIRRSLKDTRVASEQLRR